MMPMSEAKQKLHDEYWNNKTKAAIHHARALLFIYAVPRLETENAMYESVGRQFMTIQQNMINEVTEEGRYLKECDRIADEMRDLDDTEKEARRMMSLTSQV